MTRPSKQKQPHADSTPKNQPQPTPNPEDQGSDFMDLDVALILMRGHHVRLGVLVSQMEELNNSAATYASAGAPALNVLEQIEQVTYMTSDLVEQMASDQVRLRDAYLARHEPAPA